MGNASVKRKISLLGGAEHDEFLLASKVLFGFAIGAVLNKLSGYSSATAGGVCDGFGLEVSRCVQRSKWNFKKHEKPAVS